MDRYLSINDVLNQLYEEVGVELWILDSLWWVVFEQEDGDPNEPPVGIEDLAQRFGLERYLQEFLRDNLTRIDFFKDWDIYEEDGGHWYRSIESRITTDRVKNANLQILGVISFQPFVDIFHKRHQLFYQLLNFIFGDLTSPVIGPYISFRAT